MTITRTIELANITPEELAEAFCEMDGEMQGEFFAHIWHLAKSWPGAGWCQQSCSIAETLPYDGKKLIETLAAYVLGEEPA